MGQLGWLTYELEVYRDWFKEPGFSSFMFSTVHDTLELIFIWLRKSH